MREQTSKLREVEAVPCCRRTIKITNLLGVCVKMTVFAVAYYKCEEES